MLDFLAHLFDTSDFPPRWHCGSWTEAHGWLHIVSDLGVWSAYFAIPCILAFFVLRRQDIPFRAIFWLFVAFILACGTTHLMEALIFWWPAYRLAGVVKLLTAVVSWATVFALIQVVPKALTVRSPEELERIVKERTVELTKTVDALQTEIRERQWIEDKQKRNEAEIARLNQELQSRVDELQTVLDVVPIGIAIAHDAQCRRITHNPFMSELLGVSAWQNASLTAPEDERPTNFANYRDGKEVPGSELPMQVACTGREVRDVELDLICQGRSPRKMLYHARPLFDAHGQVRGSVGACLDITARQQAQEALRQADRRKDEFLATLAHELRNPLAPIRNSVTILQAKPAPDPQSQWARDVIERQVQVMARLLDDLLEISRISRNKLELRKERVELAAVIQTAIEISRPLIEASAQEMTLNIPTEPIHLDGDPTRLAQIFSNLLNNAAKFSEKEGHIWLTVERRDGEVVVVVRDTGVGIAAEHLDYIFEMFSQVSQSVEQQGGLGIGLSLVRGLAELHGGKVEARSAGPGKGSEFVVRLPVIEAWPPSRQPETDGKQAAAAPKTRILVVDDNRDAAESLAMMLRLQGHEIRTAHDGVEALQAAATFRPDVLLLDIGMPKMNGYEVARSLRQQPWGQSMVLIALTGWGQEEDKKRAAEAGFDHHLTKPADPANLEKLLASVASRGR